MGNSYYAGGDISLRRSFFARNLTSRAVKMLLRAQSPHIFTVRKNISLFPQNNPARTRNDPSFGFHHILPRTAMHPSSCGSFLGFLCIFSAALPFCSSTARIFCFSVITRCLAEFSVSPLLSRFFHPALPRFPCFSASCFFVCSTSHCRKSAFSCPASAENRQMFHVKHCRRGFVVLLRALLETFGRFEEIFPWI